MSNAPSYNPQTDFSLNQVLEHDKLDNEFQNLSASINALKENLQKIQRSDDELANDAVHRDAITNEALTLFRTGAWNWRQSWLPNVGYNTRDIVHEAGSNRLWVAVADQPPAAAFTNTLHWVDVTSGPAGAQGPEGDPFGANPIDKLGSYTVVITDRGQAHHVDATAGTANVLLPLAATALPEPWVLVIVKQDDSTNPVVVTPQGGELIEGSAQVSLTKKGDFVSITPRGPTEWAAFFSAGTVGFALPLPLSSGGTGGTDAPTARLSLGLGSSAVLDAGLGPNEVVQRDLAGDIPGLPSLPSVPFSIANGGTGATDAANARINLGLGTAAQFNAGLNAGELLPMFVTNQLPAIDGSLLTGIVAGGGLARAYVGAENTPTLTATLNAGEKMIAFFGTTADVGEGVGLLWLGATIESLPNRGGGLPVFRFAAREILTPGTGNLQIVSTNQVAPFIVALVYS